MAPPDPDLDTVRCPTCRALQPWSDTCRRCKSDLRLLRAFAEASRLARQTCLRHLRAGQAQLAWLAARKLHDLTPTDESRRLLAVSALFRGDLATATDLARQTRGSD
jgi:hypothetical protein